MADLEIPPGSYESVLRMLDSAWKLAKRGEKYDGARTVGAGGGSGGHNKLIKVGTAEEQIIADRIEDGDSLTAATEAVNDYRIKHGITPHVGRSAVLSAYHRLEPVVTHIALRPQGNFDPGSPWLI